MLRPSDESFSRYRSSLDSGKTGRSPAAGGATRHLPSDLISRLKTEGTCQLNMDLNLDLEPGPEKIIARKDITVQLWQEERAGD